MAQMFPTRISDSAPLSERIVFDALAGTVRKVTSTVVVAEVLKKRHECRAHAMHITNDIEAFVAHLFPSVDSRAGSV